jgi:hypothetical protein
MDHGSNAPHLDPCCAFAIKRRQAEPYLFFVGLLVAIALAICAVTHEAFSQVGPNSAQHHPGAHGS